MQTFLPFQDFGMSAAVLDNRRLGKQRVETLQIMKALLRGEGWVNHPATLMWRRYEWALMQYQESICAEWTSRGYKDTCLEKTRKLYEGHSRWVEQRIFPYWIGEKRFHISHQSNLKRKDPDHYNFYFPLVSNNLEYIWPLPEPEYTRLRDKILWAA